MLPYKNAYKMNLQLLTIHAMCRPSPLYPYFLTGVRNHVCDDPSLASTVTLEDPSPCCSIESTMRYLVYTRSQYHAGSNSMRMRSNIFHYILPIILVCPILKILATCSAELSMAGALVLCQSSSKLAKHTVSFLN